MVGMCASALVLAISAIPVFAASNPSGTGQPNQSCQQQTSSPAGFNTAGFTGAALVYAGSQDSPTINNGANGAAVSQYDVACFQVSH